MVLALVCPGQGSQAVGMGKTLADAFPAARAVFDEVDVALGESLSTLMFDGPLETLTQTANAQPALMAVSVAVARVLAAEAGFDAGRDAAFLAGHSLGEYSALTVAGSLDLGDAARLLRLRGKAMQSATPAGIGAMAALLGVDIDDARSIAEAAAGGDVCDIANDNGAGQIVLSGHKAAVERAATLAKERGKRAMMLPVSAPFHCALMAPAAEAMRDALSRINLRAPSIPIVANVSAESTRDPAVLRAGLVRQVTATVRWRESVAAMVGAGVTRMVEIGAGKVLTGIAKRLAPNVAAAACGTADDIRAYSAGSV
jgi:[acyl-carrier-protein] S-malonyltransferase